MQIIPSKLLVRNSLQAYWHFWGLCLWHLWSALPYLFMAQFSQWLLSSYSCCCLFKAAHPKWFPDKVQASPGVPQPSCIFLRAGAFSVSYFISEAVKQCPVIFCNQLKGQSIHFVTSRLSVCPKASYNASHFPDLAAVVCFIPWWCCSCSLLHQM
jgi:hypothetical protein